MATGRGANRKRKGKGWRGDGEIRAMAGSCPIWVTGCTPEVMTGL